MDYLVKGETEDVLKKAQEVAESVGSQSQGGAWGLIRVGISDNRADRCSPLTSHFSWQSTIYATTVKYLRRSAENPRRTPALDDAEAKARL